MMIEASTISHSAVRNRNYTIKPTFTENFNAHEFSWTITEVQTGIYASMNFFKNFSIASPEIQ